MNVHARPEEIREFATILEQFYNETEDSSCRVRQKFESLDWQDAVRERFAEQLADIHNALVKFKAESEDVVADLRRRAEVLDNYFDVR